MESLDRLKYKVPHAKVSIYLRKSRTIRHRFHASGRHIRRAFNAACLYLTGRLKVPCQVPDGIHVFRQLQRQPKPFVGTQHTQFDGIVVLRKEGQNTQLQDTP